MKYEPRALEELLKFTEDMKAKYKFKKDYTARSNMSHRKKGDFFTEYVKFIIYLVEKYVRPLEENETPNVQKILAAESEIGNLDKMLRSVSPMDALNYGLAHSNRGIIFADDVITEKRNR